MISRLLWKKFSKGLPTLRILLRDPDKGLNLLRRIENKSNKAKAPDPETQQKTSTQFFTALTQVVVALIGGGAIIIAALLGSPWFEGIFLKPTLTPIIEGSVITESTFTLSPEDTPFPTEALIIITPSDPLIGRDGMHLVEIPAGEFLMGSKGNEPDESPVHTVYITLS
jgi:formylglycine-generating enzyme required for sulfatase activity